ncbi:MAG: ABC transporter substrate-binding protein [Acidimicrobiia bacterium]
MRKRLNFVVLIAVIALVAAACASSGDDTTTTADAGAGETTTTAPAATTTTAAATTTAADPGADMKTDIGVDADAKVITIGLLADLTGLFAALVTDITDAQQVYWDNVNASGGIDGWTVELLIEDTNYNVEQHQEKYEKIRNEVVAISQSTGSPTNVATLDKYKEDNTLVIPLSWYSGWGIPDFDGGVMLEQNTNYCLEAMNLLDFVNEMGGTTIALATFPGDYGQDAAAGVKKAVEFYGMELVYDGEAAVIPGQDQTAVIQGIVGSGADWTFMTTNPSIGAEILGGAVQSGYTGFFTGSSPTYDFRLLDSPAGPLYDAVYYQSAYNVAWGTDTPGNNEMMAALTDKFPDRRPSDSFIVGWNEAITMNNVLSTAIANGDLTKAGVVAAANTLTGVDFGGSAPDQNYAGTPNDYVQRGLAVFDPDLATYTAAGGAEQSLSQDGATTGSLLAKDFFVGAAAEAFDFTAPCFEI